MKRMTTPATPESNYFAYGANLHIAQMKSLCPRSAPVCPARLQEYRLTIALPATAPGNQPGWATVTPHKGAEAPGALFRLHSDEPARARSFRGLPGALRPERSGNPDGRRPPLRHALHHAASYKGRAPGGALRRNAQTRIQGFRFADGGIGERSRGDLPLVVV